METIHDYLRGLRAAVAPRAFVALGWAWFASVAVAALFTTLVFLFVQSSVTHSAMAEELRQGQSGTWIVDLMGQPGVGSVVQLLAVLALLLVPAYLVLTVFLSGGVVSSVLRALGMTERREYGTFFGESARFVGPMFRFALVEVVVVGIFVTGLLIVRGIGASAGPGFAWGWVVVTVFVLAFLTSLFDFGRIWLVAHDSRSAIDAFREGMGFLGRRPLAILLVVTLNLVLAIAVAGSLLWLHGRIDLSTGGGVFLGLLVGQLSVAGRLWARIAAYATEAAIWDRDATAEPVEEEIDRDVQDEKDEPLILPG